MKINTMDVRAVIAMTLLLYVAADDSEPVTFEGEYFTMRCPGEQKLFKDNSDANNTVQYHDQTKGLYRCEKGKYFFYVKANLCLNCFNLDGALFAQVIAVDMTGTIILMIVIYRCTKKRSAGSTNTSKAPARAVGRAPPVPSPDYEPLNPHTRAQDPYSIVNRTG
ncbi:T-cell surface glycoprotein CD3 epsilon chain [Paralichthys olivaceus]|uniref:T-cell surface glycoprotein CD3 epsilon chain n=1 Tax=Paralichthys olivaceus TaxID=8255 RepID=UPI00097D23C6|nr:PREDICTED: T-cell surface glycoprotein CD3 epsilon chain [Paralichthys olivaceus]